VIPSRFHTGYELEFKIFKMSYLDHPKIPSKPDIIPSPKSRSDVTAANMTAIERSIENAPLKFSFQDHSPEHDIEPSFEERDQIAFIKNLHSLQEEVRQSSCGQSHCRDILKSLES
jgi:hypothetical protein